MEVLLSCCVLTVPWICIEKTTSPNLTHYYQLGSILDPSVVVLGHVAQVSLMLAQFPMTSNFVHVLQGSGNGPGSTDLSALIFLFRSALHICFPHCKV